jgi:large subunit ribosomal protein L20
LTKGYFGSRKNVWTVAKNTWEKGQQYAYRDRKQKKRNFRVLWIQRINAAARMEGLSYSKLINLLKKSNVEINRKVLADLAMNHQEVFRAVVEKVK